MRFNSVSNREIFSNPAGKVAVIYLGEWVAVESNTQPALLLISSG